MNYSPDNFDRVVLPDGHLLGSACTFCRRFIGFSRSHEELSKLEQAHTCLEMKTAS
jgi:hypothetical protein